MGVGGDIHSHVICERHELAIHSMSLVPAIKKRILKGTLGFLIKAGAVH